VGLIGVVTVGIYAWDKFAPVSKQTEYADLRLGMTRDQVKSIKGYPTVNVTRDNRGWSYQAEPGGIGRIDLKFDEAGLIIINCHSINHYSHKCPTIAGIVDGSKEEDVIQKFGKPDIVRTAIAPWGGHTMKYLYYKTPSVHFWLERDQVNTLGIGAPTPPDW
jgi:hypothetical protein